MDAAGIQAKINRGAAIANRYLGRPYAWYRPRGAGNPLAPGNRLGTLRIDAKSDYGFAGTRPSLHGKPVWAALFDWGSAAVGDYVVGKAGTFFVAAMQEHVPAAMVACNRVLTFARPGSQQPGAKYYGGDVAASEVTLLTGWPAALLQGPKGVNGPTGLPGDDRMPWSAVWLPVLPVQLRTGDFATDEQAMQMRYEVSGAENSDLGWRLTVAEMVT